jgi:hypothetical protein
MSYCEFKILRFRIDCGITGVESQDEKRNNPGYFEELFWNVLAGTEKTHKDIGITVWGDWNTTFPVVNLLSSGNY